MPGLVPGIHVFLCCGSTDVNRRDEPGHDGERVDHYEGWYYYHLFQDFSGEILRRTRATPLNLHSMTSSARASSTGGTSRTGSPTPTNTIGSFPAIGFSTASARLLNTMMTSGENASSSATTVRICSGPPLHQRT